MQRVVVTGIGAITSLAHNAKETFKGLLESRSGVGPITQFDASSHESRIAAEVKNPPLKDYFDVKSLKKFDRFSQFAWIAAQEAVEMSGMVEHGYDPERCGAIIGSGIGGIQTLESTMQNMQRRGPRGVSPFFISNLISNEAGGNVAIRYNLKGVNYGIVSACTTGTHCVGEAFRQIALGEQDIILAGGAEASVTPLTVAGFSNMKAMSRRNEEPARASRPFDKDRDGFVMGEGAGVLVMESLEHAKARGAKVLAEVSGYGVSCDAHHITAIAPGGEGMARAARLALKQARMSPQDIQYVNVHGTSTPIGDRYETQCVKTVFGEHAGSLALSSTKSMIGHLLGAAGGVESVVCVQTLMEQAIHATVNLDQPDEECDLDFVAHQSRELPIKAVLKHSMGFGGHNAALIFQRFDG